MQLRLPSTTKNRALVALVFGTVALSACGEGATVDVQTPVLELDPAVVNFGNVQLGTREEQVVLLQNNGEANLVITQIAPEAGSGFDENFELGADANDDSAIPPNNSRPFTVSFEPEVLGEATGTLIITSNSDPGAVLRLEVRANGVATPLVVDPDEIDFGNTVVGTTKTVQVKIQNDSDVDATVSLGEGPIDVRLCSDRTAPAPFCIQLADDAIVDGRFDLAARAQTTMLVQFRPEVAERTERGSFVLRACNNDLCNVQVRVEGRGVDSGFRCSPTDLDFGAVTPQSSAERSVSCENIANELVTVTNWRLSEESSAAYEFETPRILVVNEGEQVDVTVTYRPDDLGQDRGTLIIETNSPSTPRVNVPLFGTGGGPNIEVVPQIVNFGLTATVAPSRRTLLVSNVGLSPLQLLTIEPDAADTGAFSYTLPDGVQLVDPINPGQAIEVTLQFEPDVEGPVESTLVITSNDADERETEVRLVGEGIDLPPCQFRLSPETLSFGVVQRDRSLRRSFAIQNVGAEDCLLTSVRVERDSDPQFILVDGDVESEIIPPNTAYAVTVAFTPDSSVSFDGAIAFSISSDQSPFNRVPLFGVGAEQTLQVVPRELDFGVIEVGCSSRSRTIRIDNTGSTPATINGVSLDQPDGQTAFQITRAPTFPLTLGVNRTIEFDVSFRADAESDFIGAVVIDATFQGASDTYIVSLDGSGEVAARQVDEFSQLGRPQVDILFVIDHTGSMGDEQAAIASNFEDFIRFAQAQALDYQLGVTTTDIDDEEGRLCPENGPQQARIVTPDTTPDPVTVFANNVSCRSLAGGGAADESGFEAAYLALSPPTIFSDNLGFLRPEAVLSIIFVSDAAEQSPRSIDFYRSFFLSLKPDENLFSASAISGPISDPPPPNCSLDPTQGGERYVEMAQRTGGVWQEICISDWSRTLEELSTTAFGFKSRFFLSNQPLRQTVEVVVDGVTIPATSQGGTSNWRYESSANSINFTPFATPEPGAEITVRYTPECL